MIYDILIRPIEWLIEVFFWISYEFFQNAPAAVISVSILVSFLVLPLYLRADAIQEEEQKKQKAMEVWIAHIRKSFKGDERYMILNAYYREQGYRPLYALRGMISLLLQIPFFIAAYHYLSNLELLRECSFGRIASLGEPDRLLRFGTLRIHFLPILMTLINCVSGVIYTKNAPKKQRLQVFALAFIFLLLLYESPSGLVLYWTMNNLFSLCKNLIQRYVKHPGAVMRWGAAAFAGGYLCDLIVSKKWMKLWGGQRL